MLNDLKPYANALRPVPNEPWLGAVPEHWTPIKLKHVLAERNERGYPAEPLLAATQTKGVVLKSDYGTRTVEAMKDLHLLKLVQVGDFVISLRSFQGGIEFARTQGIISPAYTILYPRDSAAHGYLAALFKSRPFIGNLTLYVTGIRQGQNIDYVKLGRSSIPLPPPAEQAGIVRFLGAVDRKVNRFIRAKLRLIEVLTEQKQAIITHAVTRGLNPAAPLKPSGIDWLGDVPEHWAVARAGSVAEFISTKAHEQFVEDDGVHICVTARFVSTDGRSFRRCTQNFSPARRGDVLMVMSDLPRGRALARAYLVNDDQSYAVNQRVCILRPKRVDPRYLTFAANRHPELLAQDDGFNQTHLPNAAFKTMRLALPPLDEQAAIADSLVRTTSAIDATIERTEREIDLIREYRTRLVADVVTGKVDVRAAAAAIPDEAQGPGTDQGAGADDPGSGDDDADADLEPAPDGAGTEGEDEA